MNTRRACVLFARRKTRQAAFFLSSVSAKSRQRERQTMAFHGLRPDEESWLIANERELVLFAYGFISMIDFFFYVKRKNIRRFSHDYACSALAASSVHAIHWRMLPEKKQTSSTFFRAEESITNRLRPTRQRLPQLFEERGNLFVIGCC